MNGTYLEIEGQPALRFERSLPHSIERVWRALTEPGEIRQWFPAAVELDLRVGGEMSFEFDDSDVPPTRGAITELDPPRLFAFDWGGEKLRFELEPGGDGCRLRFTHFLSERIQAARDAAGWDQCLTELDRLLAGQTAQAPAIGATPEWQTLYDKYVAEGLPSGAEIPGMS